MNHLVTLLILVMSVLFTSACSNMSYYQQSISGHFSILSKREPVEKLLQQNELEPALRERLVLSQQVRTFASEQLLLPDNDSYREYVDLGRDQVVWVVAATEAFSVEPLQHCFLIVGCLSYRGFFHKEDAQSFAANLKAQGKDVMLSGSSAYSTLGWLDDPLLNTMIKGNESSMIEVIFHELAHQKIYVDGETEFNESFATVVAEEGVKRWYLSRQQQTGYQAYLQKKAKQRAFNQLLNSTRERLQSLYMSRVAHQKMAQQKQSIFAELQQQYQQLKQSWNGYSGYDEWMGQKLNNAHLAMIATYHRQVPKFKQLLAAVEGDLSQFYQQISHQPERETTFKVTTIE